MNCVSCDICVYHLWFVCVLPSGIPQLQSDWSLSCDHGLDYASECENNNKKKDNKNPVEKKSSRKGPFSTGGIPDCKRNGLSISLFHFFLFRRIFSQNSFYNNKPPGV